MNSIACRYCETGIALPPYNFNSKGARCQPCMHLVAILSAQVAGKPYGYKLLKSAYSTEKKEQLAREAHDECSAKRARDVERAKKEADNDDASPERPAKRVKKEDEGDYSDDDDNEGDNEGDDDGDNEYFANNVFLELEAKEVGGGEEECEDEGDYDGEDEGDDDDDDDDDKGEEPQGPAVAATVLALLLAAPAAAMPALEVAAPAAAVPALQVAGAVQPHVAGPSRPRLFNQPVIHRLGVVQRANAGHY